MAIWHVSFLPFGTRLGFEPRTSQFGSKCSPDWANEGRLYCSTIILLLLFYADPVMNLSALLWPGQFLVCPPLCLSPTVPNLYSNVHECKKFEVRAHSCWGEHESCKFFIWARFFRDNSKITVRHVRSQLEKVRFIYANEHEYECEVTQTSRVWVR